MFFGQQYTFHNAEIILAENVDNIFSGTHSYKFCTCTCFTIDNFALK